MTRRQQQGIVLAVLVGVMAAVYVRAFAPRGPLPESAAAPEPVPATAEAAAPEAPVSSEVLARREAQRARAAGLDWSRDPFIRGRGAGPMGGFTLSGILWDTQQPIAIINGEMLRVGEELDGYRVAEIGQDRVSLTDGTHTYQILIAP